VAKQQAEYKETVELAKLAGVMGPEMAKSREQGTGNRV
jgi:hypothetical protein